MPIFMKRSCGFVLFCLSCWMLVVSCSVVVLLPNGPCLIPLDHNCINTRSSNPQRFNIGGRVDYPCVLLTSLQCLYFILHQSTLIWQPGKQMLNKHQLFNTQYMFHCKLFNDSHPTPHIVFWNIKSTCLKIQFN